MVMRTLYFLVPGTSGKYRCGGLFAELNTLALAQEICPAEVVTYRQREAGTLFLADVLKTPGDRIFVVSWGFQVPKQLAKLKGEAVVYHAHSAGYGFRIPASIPIITVSRNTLGYWGQHCANGALYYLPNVIGDEFGNRQLPRDIDVLVQARKSSEYMLKQLVPALQKHCNVVLLDHFVEDLGELFNRSKVYLYDSAEYWAQYRLTEGFGLPPMEAMACGCQAFSSLNSALADYLDPAFNCQKIGVYSTAYDVERILAAVTNPHPVRLPERFFEPYRRDKVLLRLRQILSEINQFFDHAAHHPSDIPDLSTPRLTRLRLQRTWAKIRQRLGG